MINYLIEADYLPAIQIGNKAAISQNNKATQTKAEQTAMAEAISFLKQKYDTTQEFTNTMVWSLAGPAAYPGRTPLAASAWVASTTYAIGAQIQYTDSNIYQCITANSDLAFNPANWLNLGPAGTIPYYANDRVYLTAALYSPSAAYALGSLTLYVAPWVSSSNYATNSLIVFTDGNVYQCQVANADASFTASKWLNIGPQGSAGTIYQCTTAIATPGEAFNPAHWLSLGQINTIYYVPYPVPVFNLANGQYKIGDQVFWKNKIYTCLIGTQNISQQGALQYYQQQNVPYPNVFPDTPVHGVLAWGAGIPYVVPQGTAIANTTYWTQGDNRDQQLVQKLVDITVYHLSRNIPPKNIPVTFVHAYMGDPEDRQRQTGHGRILYPVYSALGWLQACATGTDVSPNLPLLQPPKGRRINSGGPVKLENYI